ncbi:MAG: hypothetical protein KC425_02860, partial [Anaerolineales bacterium]|nr:hypothetical protein [Anaerolineales bacterium]
FYALLVDGTVGVVTAVFAGWWLLVALAAACGAVGGALAPPRREAPAGVVAPLAEVLPPVLFVGALTSMLALLLTTAGFGLLGPQVAAAAGEHLNWRAGTLLSFRTGTILVDGGQGAGSGLAAGVRYPPMLASVLPLGSALLLTLAFVAGYWRSLQPPARPDGPSRRRAVGSAYALALLGSLLVLGLPEMVMDAALRTVVRVGVAPLLLLCLLLVQTAVRLAARDARETAVGWLLASPLAGLVMAYGLSWAGWNGAALGLVVGLAAAVLLALSQAPPEPAVAPELAQTPLALSRLLPGALVLVLPLLLPLAAALGLVFIPVAAIGVLGAYPGGGALPGSAAPLAFQVRSLYAFGALALLVGLLLGLLLMGLSVVAARLRDGRRREG